MSIYSLALGFAFIICSMGFVEYVYSKSRRWYIARYIASKLSLTSLALSSKSQRRTNLICIIIMNIWIFINYYVSVWSRYWCVSIRASAFHIVCAPIRIHISHWMSVCCVGIIAFNWIVVHTTFICAIGIGTSNRACASFGKSNFGIWRAGGRSVRFVCTRESFSKYT